MPGGLLPDKVAQNTAVPCKYETNVLTNDHVMGRVSLPQIFRVACLHPVVAAASMPPRYMTPMGKDIWRHFRRCRRCVCAQISDRAVWDSRQALRHGTPAHPLQLEATPGNSSLIPVSDGFGTFVLHTPTLAPYAEEQPR